MNVLKLVVGLGFASALVVFGAQNTQSVSFHFLVWDTASVPVVLALAIAVLVGVLLSWIVSVPVACEAGWTGAGCNERRARARNPLRPSVTTNRRM
jgi:uncharacterized membrane protein YciS (DUF1049 family)